MTKKTNGWENRLVEYLSDCASSPFRPGKLDCGLFFSGAVEVMTGEVIDKKLRGKYRSLKKAYEILNGMGFENHVEYVASLYSERPCILHAVRGDGAEVVDMDGNAALGVVQGEHIYVIGLNGLGTVPLTDAKRIFAV